MSEREPVNQTREARLEAMLRAKRAQIVTELQRALGERVGEDPLASLEETIEVGDRATLSHDQDVGLGVLQLKREEVRQIERAIRRLAAGEYGRCEECESPIGEERLEILPFADLCVDCKRRQEADSRWLEATGRGFRAGFRDIREDASEDEED